jgi:hypothetical protein
VVVTSAFIFRLNRLIIRCWNTITRRWRRSGQTLVPDAARWGLYQEASKADPAAFQPMHDFILMCKRSARLPAPYQKRGSYW